MVRYIYAGPRPRLRINGTALVHGVPTALSGRAAEMADARSDVIRVQPGPAPAPVAEDLATLTVAQLRERLAERGLPVYGTKATLIERLGA